MDFKAEDIKIEEVFFANYIYEIPIFQRPYAWDNDKIDDFWNDLISNDESYFLGTFIFNYKKEGDLNRIEIVDGQQRALTITILMAVLRDLAKEIEPGKEKELAKRIQRKTITQEDRKGKETYRIICGESTKEFFQNYIQLYNSNILESEPTTEEEKLVKKNYEELKGRINNELLKKNNEKDKKEYLQLIWDKVAELKVVRIKIDEEEDAYEVFETVNARGLDLSVADLLKNLVFKSLKSNEKDINEYRTKWKEIEDNILGENLEMTKFIRHYWLSRYSFVTEKKLFREIKKKVKNYDVFFRELHEASIEYSRLQKGDLNQWKVEEEGREIHQYLEGIRIMRVVQCYTFFLSIMRNLKKVHINPKRYFNLIEKFSFVYSIIGKQRTNKLEKIYSEYAIKIEQEISDRSKNDKHTIGNVNKILSEFENKLKELKPSYELFESNFMSLNCSNSEKSRVIVKYILSKIEGSLGTGESKINFNVVNIEHFLPKTPSKEWKVSQEDIKDYVNKLGNLTIVHEKINSRAGNRGPKDKCEELKNSEIRITSNLINSVEKNNYIWGLKEIDNRQKELSKISFNKVWNF